MIMAAFRPDTYRVLRDAGLMAPTTQMVFRMGRIGVQSLGRYLRGSSHPSVFNADTIDLPAMIRLANALTPDAVPPVVRLEVKKDFTATPGIDYLRRDVSEKIFTTPVAISRAWRSFVHEREVVLSAEQTVDPNGRELTFEWVLLRGDPERVRISHDDPERRTARISIDWHDVLPTPGAPDLTPIGST